MSEERRFVTLVMLGAMALSSCGGEDKGGTAAPGPVGPAGAGQGSSGTLERLLDRARMAGAAGGAGGMATSGPGSGGAVGTGMAGGTAGTSAMPSDPTWTVFVYGHADHNLSASLFADLVEMVGARFDGNKINLIVLADWDARRRIPDDGRNFPTGSFWYRVDGAGDLAVIESGPELDLDDPRVVASAVQRVVQRFPADRYGIVFWNHGGGWDGGFGGDGQDGARATPAGIGIEDLAAGLRQGLAAAGRNGGRPLDFLAFDTCLLGGVETMAAFADLAQVFIAAAELDYGNGWDYRATLTWLGRNRRATAREFAAAEVAAWDAHHADQGPDDRLLRSHVALDLAETGALAAAVTELGAAARGAPAALSRAMLESVPQYMSQIAEPAPSALRDIGQVLRQLAARGGSLQGPAAAALQVLSRAIIASSKGRYRAGQDGVNGLAAPALEIESAALQRYPARAATWERLTGWGALMSHLQRVADLTEPAIQGDVTVPANPSPGNLPRVDFTLADPDAAWAQSYLLQISGARTNQFPILGTLYARFLGPGSYRLSWTGAQYSLRASPRNLAVTANPWIFASTPAGIELPILAVPGVLQFAWGEELPCQVLVDRATGLGSTVVVQEGQGSTALPLEYFARVDRDTLFVPVFDVLDAGAGTVGRRKHELGMRLSAVNYRLQFEAAQASAGDYVILLQVMDVWGNSGFAAYPVALAAPIPRQ